MSSNQGARALTVSCQHCGAPLEVSHDIRFVTCSYCRARLEIVHDATQVHSRLLEEMRRHAATTAESLNAIAIQGEIDRLDREWHDSSRAEPVIPPTAARAEHPYAAVPVIVLPASAALLSAAAALVFDLWPAWILVAVFALVGLMAWRSTNLRLNQAETAEARYRRQRASLVASLRNERGKS